MPGRRNPRSPRRSPAASRNHAPARTHDRRDGHWSMTTISPESCAALERRERPERLSILEPDIPALCQPLTAVGAIRIDERHLEGEPAAPGNAPGLRRSLRYAR